MIAANIFFLMGRCIRCLLLVVLLIACGAWVSGASAATVSGTVNVPSGYSASGICLEIFDAEEDFYLAGKTGAGGGYLLAGVPPGTYTVKASARKAGCSNQNLAHAYAEIDVVPDTSNVGNDFELVVGATIAGVVTVPTGYVSSGICVEIDQVGGRYLFTDYLAGTGTGGTFSFSGLPAGTYSVKVISGPGMLCLEQGQGLAPATSPDIAVTVGEESLSNTIPLDVGATISGRVYVAAGSDADLCITLSAPSVEYFSASTKTTAGGDYLIEGLPAGVYRVRATAGNGCSNQNLAPSFLYGIEVSIGEISADNDLTMLVGATVSGSIGVPVDYSDSGLCVLISDNTDFGYEDYQDTTSGGAYSFTGLPAGSYTVRVQAGAGCSGQDLATATLTPVVVEAGETSLDNDITLVVDTVISGTVSVPAGYSPMGVCVTLRGSSGSYEDEMRTRSSGAYSFAGLPAGTYTVTASSGDECSSQNLVTASISNVTVASGQRRLSENFTLVPGATISGTVRVPSDFSPEGICIDLFNETIDERFYTITEIDGRYRHEGLPAGTYTITADTSAGCADPELESAAVSGATVVAGQSSSGHDITLRRPQSPPTPNPAASPPPATRMPSASPSSIGRLQVKSTAVNTSGIVVRFVALSRGTARVEGIAAGKSRLARGTTKLCRGSLKVTKIGSVKVVCALTSAGKRLRRAVAFTMTLNVSFASDGGGVSTAVQTKKVLKSK